MNINSKNIFYTVVLGIILLGLLCSCNRENKTGPLTWKVKNGTLTISGKGSMPNYDRKEGGPWNDLNKVFPGIMAIIINDGVFNIGEYAFVNNYYVVYVSIPDSVTNIGENAFKGCSSITSITIPNGVLNIDNSAFQDCIKLIAVDISDSVLKIGNNAFTNCYSLLNVTLGKNVAYIDFDAFQGCSKILTVTSNNPIPPNLETSLKSRAAGLEGINDPALKKIVSPFDSVSNKCRLLVPDEFIAAYREDAQWRKFYR